jgi:hypothetical protein
MHKKLHHVGIQGRVSRSTLADANEKRDWRIYCDFAQVLIAQARKFYADDDFGLQLNETVYALDSSTIDLCRSIFPWARFRSTKSGIKLHTLLDLRGIFPLRIKSFFGTSPTAAKTQIWIAISIYVMVAIMKKKLKLEHSLYTIYRF